LTHERNYFMMKTDDSDKGKIVTKIKALKIITVYMNHVIH